MTEYILVWSACSSRLPFFFNDFVCLCLKHDGIHLIYFQLTIIYICITSSKLIRLKNQMEENRLEHVHYFSTGIHNWNHSTWFRQYIFECWHLFFSSYYQTQIVLYMLDGYSLENVGYEKFNLNQSIWWAKNSVQIFNPIE